MKKKSVTLNNNKDIYDVNKSVHSNLNFSNKFNLAKKFALGGVMTQQLSVEGSNTLPN